jgi:hypothetical protein
MAISSLPSFASRRMTRREFLQLASASAGTVLVTSVLSGCGGGGSPANMQYISAASGPAGSPALNSLQSPAASPQQPPSSPSQPAPSQPPAQQPSPPQQQVTGNPILDFTFSSSVSQTLAPFALGQAFRQGEIPAGSAIVATLPNFQAVIKNRWADGSAKFAILSGRATLIGGVPLTVSLSRGTVSGGVNLTEQDLRDTGVTASIQFAPHGTVQLASLIGVASTYNSTARRWTAGRVREWISGSEMACWIYCSPIGSDAHLAAWFEVRIWRGGFVEVLPWVENGYLNTPNPTNKAGSVAFSLGGQTRYSEVIDLPHHCRAPLASGATLSHWLGSNPQIVLRHNTAYLQTTKVVPAYYGNTLVASPLWLRLATSYTPLAQGNYPAAMGAAGYHASIGLLPEWDAAYLTSSGDARAFASVIVNAYCAGRYGVHYRDETTNRPLRFSQYPNLCLHGTTSGVRDQGTSATNTYTPPVSGTAPPVWASSHGPSIGYMAYLLTGRFYFLEELQFLATLHFLKQNNEVRQRSGGVMETAAGANTTRGAAWALRTLAQTASVTPDDDTPLRTEFLNSVEANVVYYHARYIAIPNHPQGVCQPYSNYGSDPYKHSIWMEDFLTAAFGWMNELGLAISPATQTKFRALLDWKFKSVIGRLGGASAMEYCVRDAAQYEMAVAPRDASNWQTGAGPWYVNWGEMYVATTGHANDCSVSTALRGSSGADPHAMATGYWGNLMPAIAYAVDYGASDASAAYGRLVTASNFASAAASFNDTPVWGIKPRSAAPVVASPPLAQSTPLPSTGLPSWVTSLPLWRWHQIPNTSLASVEPTPRPPGITGPSSKIGAWCGAGLKRQGSVYVIGAAGGHGDYAGNEVDALYLNSENPRWVQLRAPTETAKIIDRSPLYLDHRPAASHTYWFSQFINARNRMMVFATPGMNYGSLPAPPTGWPYTDLSSLVHSFTMDANDWDPPDSIARFPGSGDHYGALCVKHPVTEDVYLSKNYDGGDLYKWSQARNAWSLVGRTGRSLYYCGAAIDPDRARMLLVGSYSGDTAPQVMTLSGASVPVTFGGVGPAALTKGGYPGVVYDEANDRFLAFLNEGTSIRVYRIHPETWIVEEIAMAGVPPAARDSAILNAVQYVPELRGIVIANSYNGNVFFARVSA